jgi:mannosyltransferase
VSGSSAGAAALRGGHEPQASGAPRRSALAAWWPLLAITVLAAVLRLGTLSQQSLWYDEAFTPVHVLRASLGATLHNVVHTENTPPLWYVLEWGVSRVLGTGAVALRLLSALAGIATVPVAWAIGCELEYPSGSSKAGRPHRRAAIATAAFVATSPLFVWYSQEARAYGLFVLMSSLALLCFLRALHVPTNRRLAEFALTASLALLTHYFALFLLIPMALWLVWGTIVVGRGNEKGMTRARARDSQKTGDGTNGDVGPRERAAIPKNPFRVLCAVAIPVLVGAALIPLILAQGGHGTQWIGEWALASRLEAIPQYYLTGYTGSALGHGVELLVAVTILAGIVYGLWCTLTPREERGALIALSVVASGVLLPIALALLGADYLAPRNLVAAMVPASALLAIVIVAQRTGRIGMALAGLVALAFLALTIDVDLSPRLQRGDWSGVAKALKGGPSDRVITTVELGAAPLEYYLPPLVNLAPDASVKVSEVDETGYAPLRKSAASPPAPGFRLSERRDIHGLVVYRFTSSAPVTISERVLQEHVITAHVHPEVLVAVPPGKTT